MKRRMARIMTTVLAVSMAMGLSACGNTSSGNSSSANSTTTEAASEAAATESTDQEVTESFEYTAQYTSTDTDRGSENRELYTRTYDVSLVGMSDNTFTLTITPSAAKLADYGPQGSSIVTGEVVGGEDSDAPLDYEDTFAEASKTVSGTWSFEEGWGYTFNFEDGTSVTAGYRSEDKKMFFDYAFNYAYTIVPTDTSIASIDAEDSGTVTLECRDKDFVADANYKLPDERYAVYVLKGYGTYSQWTSEVKIYCQEDGTASVAYSSNFTTGTENGTWSMDEANHVLTLEMENNRTMRAMYDEATDSYCIKYYCAFIPAYCICGGADETVFSGNEHSDAVYTLASDTIDAADQGTCTFYMYMYDDGTCYIDNVAAVAETIERNCAAGTWTEDGGNVTVTIDGNEYTCAAGDSMTLADVAFTYTNPYYGLPWGSAATADAHDAAVTFNTYVPSEETESTETAQ